MTAWQDKNLYDRMIDRHGKLKTDRSFFDSARTTIVEHTRPDITTSVDKKGAFAGSAIIEGSGANGALVMARGFVNAMLGDSFNWFKHQMRQLFFKGNDEVNKWLQKFDEHLRWAYQISNYYNVIPRYTLDMITVGSPVIIGEENETKGIIHFSIPHYTNTWIAQDWFGDDIILHVEVKLSAKKALEMFDKDDLSAAVQMQIDQGNHNEESDYLMAIYAAGDEIFDGLKEKDKVDVNRPWMIFYIQINTNADKKKPLYSKGYWAKPFSIGHYNRQENESYSRTPAWDAIYDIKGNDSGWETMHKTTQRMVQPSMWARRMIKAKLLLGPGIVNYVDKDLFPDKPTPIEQGGNYPFGMDFVKQLGVNVERHFHVNFWQMIERFTLEHKQAPTAFQIMRMEAEKNAQVAPMVKTYERGTLEPQDSLVIDIERRSFRLSDSAPTPQIVLEESDGNVDPQFTGPLSMSQKIFMVIKKNAMARQIVNEYKDFDPYIPMKIRSSKALEQELEELGFPQDNIVPEDEYQEIVEAAQRLEEQQRLLEAGGQLAEMVPKLSGEVKKGSPMEKFTEAAA